MIVKPREKVAYGRSMRITLLLKGLGSEFIWEKFIVDGNRIGFSTLGSEQITDWYDFEFKHEFLYLVISQNNNMTLLEKVT